LREEYEVIDSEARLNPTALPLALAQSDLVFGFVTPASAYTSLGWLQGQLVVEHLISVKSQVRFMTLEPLAAWFSTPHYHDPIAIKNPPPHPREVTSHIRF
jgi:hypothetical protein